VLDEPERRLDAGMRARLAARLAAVRNAGTAVLFASHDADVVATVADEVLVVDDDACRVLPAAEAADRIAEL
jgi:ABC-2 type transport system ATP-binding protein